MNLNPKCTINTMLVFFCIKDCNPKISTIPTISDNWIVLNICYCFHTATVFQKTVNQCCHNMHHKLSRGPNHGKSVKIIHPSCLSEIRWIFKFNGQNSLAIILLMIWNFWFPPTHVNRLSTVNIAPTCFWWIYMYFSSNCTKKVLV